MKDKNIDRYLNKSTEQEKDVKNVITDLDRKIAILKNLRKYGDVEPKIEELQDIKGLESDRLNKYKQSREKYGFDESTIDEPINIKEPNMDEYIRNINNKINELDETDPDFSEKLMKLEKRKNALTDLNK